MPTDPNRVKEIFLEAVERPPGAARIEYLDRVCGADAALRERVEALLRSHDSADGFLGTPAAAPPRPDDGEKTTLKSSRMEDGSRILYDDEPTDDLGFLAPSDRPEALGRIGHYEVLEVLGRGGFGIVFRAFDKKLHRMVAIKVLGERIASTFQARARFLREARASAKVRHENVVQIHAVEEQPLPYLVMEYIPGETLQRRVDRMGALETSEALRIGRQIAEALAAAHAQGLIHRDIKPANILIEEGPHPRVKITDFGLARAADDAGVTQSGVIAGTPMYMAPEQAHGRPLDQRADLFSLGSVLYTICSGRPPFGAKGTVAVLKRVVEETPRPIREIRPEVPQWLCDVISRLHAKNPDDRFSTAAEVADLLADRPAATRGAGRVPSSPARSSAEEETLPIRGGRALTRTLEIPKTEPASSPRPRLRRWVVVTFVFLTALGSLGLAEATGVTDVRGTVVRLFSPEGTLVVEVDDPGVSLKVDGTDVVITGAGVNEIRLKPGNHQIEASKDGKFIRRELVEVTRNGRRVVRVTREAPPAEVKPAAAAIKEAPKPKAATPTDADSAWERSVAAMKAAEQVKAVAERLKELNPGFDGRILPIFEHGLVTGLQFNSEEVADISPLRALAGLTSLKCSGTEPRPGRVNDLSPLRGLRLTSLDVSHSRVADLSPIEGMPLTELWCGETSVVDLSPLRGMQLKYLNCVKTDVHDLTPLKGMPLEVLHLHKTKVALLTGLEGTQVRELMIDNTKVFDLSPLKGLPITAIDASSTPISDLSPLKGMKLKTLNCGSTFVSDLSPLAGMPLRFVGCAASRVTDDGLAALENCEDLIELAISHTRVSDAGLRHLKGLKQLRLLDMMDTKASDLTPLKGLSLDRIRLTPRNLSLKGLRTLRDMNVKTIGTDWNQAYPSSEFWARFDKGEFR